MIVAIANQNGGCGKSLVANQLALLRARSGRKVLLVDADARHAAGASCVACGSGPRPRVATRSLSGRTLQTEIDRLRRHYNDIVIDTDCRDTPESRSALIAARLVVVPVGADQVDLASQYKLIARLNSARMFNPGLHVLFVVFGGRSDPNGEEVAAIRAYVSRVMSATLAGTVIHEDCDAGEMDALYKEVFTR